MKRARSKTSFVFMLAAAAVAFWVLRPREKMLMPLATRICVWNESHGNLTTMRHNWLNANSVLEFTTSMIPSQTGVSLYDLTTKSSRELPELTQAARKSTGFPCFVSPNGLWLLCWDNMKRGIAEELSAVSTDGARVLRWPKTKNPPGYFVGNQWLPDSSAYLILFRDEALIYQFGPPAIVKRASIPLLPRYSDLITAFPSGRLLIAIYDPMSELRYVQFRFQEIGDVPREPRNFHATLPAACKVMGLTASPDNRKLAWQLEFSDTIQGGPWLRNILGWIGYSSKTRRSIWVSDLTGANFREIGHVNDGDLMLSSWVPGGKKIAFIRKGWLYTVGVGR
jgi:hypothetical protein